LCFLGSGKFGRGLFGIRIKAAPMPGFSLLAIGAKLAKTMGNYRGKLSGHGKGNSSFSGFHRKMAG